MKPVSILLLAATIAIVFCVAPPSSRAETLQAEDMLHCPGLELSADSRARLETLLKQRQELARTLPIEELEVVETAFGTRIELPKALQACLDREDEAIQAMASAEELDKIRAFAGTFRQEKSQLERVFPIRQRLGVAVTQSVARKPDGGKLYHLDLDIPADAPLYRLEHQSSINNEGHLVIKLTLVRPSLYALKSSSPEPVSLKSQIQQDSFPKAVEIWTRSIDEGMPFPVEFTRVAVMPVPAADS